MLHRSKDAKDIQDAHKVKYFLLDKNSPYVNTTEMLSTQSSSKETKKQSAAGNNKNAKTDATAAGDADVDLTNEKEPDFGSETAGDEEDSPNKSPIVPNYSPLKANGEMIGIIHGAVIKHLTIKIVTESGDYLSLTVSLMCTLERRAHLS